MMAMVISKDVKNTTSTIHNNTSPSGSRIKAMPPLTIYRPPAARNDNFTKFHLESPSVSNNSSSCKAAVTQRPQVQTQSPITSQTRRQRRPDQQMYIPRPRRSEISHAPVSFETNCCSKQLSPCQQVQPSCVQHVPRSSPVLLKRGNFRTVSVKGSDNVSPTHQSTVDSMKIDNDLQTNNRLSVNSSQDLEKDNDNCNSSKETFITSTPKVLSEVNDNNDNSSCSDFSYRTDCNSVDNFGICQLELNTVSDSNESNTSLRPNKENGINCLPGEEMLVSHSDSETGPCNKVVEDCSSSDAVSYMKRKEPSETDNIEGVDHKSKQMFLCDVETDNALIDTDNVLECADDSDLKLEVSDSCFEDSKKDTSLDGIHPQHIVANQSDSGGQDWETLFDDDGNCVEPRLLEELSKSVGEVKVHVPSSDYRPFQTIEERSSDGECIIEIYGFPAEYKTRDLLNIFAAYRNNSGFQIKWVDDTHALGVFNSPVIADEVLQCELPNVKTRPLKLALPESRMKARTIPISLPPMSRPKTCSALAHRLVTGALGLRIPTDQKKREEEKLMLKEARAQKRLAAKQREAAWDGTIGKEVPDEK